VVFDCVVADAKRLSHLCISPPSGDLFKHRSFSQRKQSISLRGGTLVVPFLPGRKTSLSQTCGEQGGAAKTGEACTSRGLSKQDIARHQALSQDYSVHLRQ